MYTRSAPLIFQRSSSTSSSAAHASSLASSLGAGGAANVAHHEHTVSVSSGGGDLTGSAYDLFDELNASELEAIFQLVDQNPSTAAMSSSSSSAAAAAAAASSHTDIVSDALSANSISRSHPCTPPNNLVATSSAAQVASESTTNASASLCSAASSVRVAHTSRSAVTGTDQGAAVRGVPMDETDDESRRGDGGHRPEEEREYTHTHTHTQMQKRSAAGHRERAGTGQGLREGPAMSVSAGVGGMSSCGVGDLLTDDDLFAALELAEQQTQPQLHQTRHAQAHPSGHHSAATTSSSSACLSSSSASAAPATALSSSSSAASVASSSSSSSSSSSFSVISSSSTSASTSASFASTSSLASTSASSSTSLSSHHYPPAIRNRTPQKRTREHSHVSALSAVRPMPHVRAAGSAVSRPDQNSSNAADRNELLMLRQRLEMLQESESTLRGAVSVLQSRLTQKDQENMQLRQQWSDITVSRKKEALTEEEYQRTSLALAQLQTQLAFKEQEMLSQAKELEQYRGKQSAAQQECITLRHRLAQLEAELEAAQLQKATEHLIPSRAASPSVLPRASPILMRASLSHHSPHARLATAGRAANLNMFDSSSMLNLPSSSLSTLNTSQAALSALWSDHAPQQRAPTWLHPAVTSSKAPLIEEFRRAQQTNPDVRRLFERCDSNGGLPFEVAEQLNSILDQLSRGVGQIADLLPPLENSLLLDDTSSGVLCLIEILVSQADDELFARLLGRRRLGSLSSVLQRAHPTPSSRLCVHQDSQSLRRLGTSAQSTSENMHGHMMELDGDDHLLDTDGVDPTSSTSSSVSRSALVSHIIERLPLWYRSEPERCQRALRILTAVASHAHTEVWPAFGVLFEAGIFHLLLDSNCVVRVKTAAIQLFGTLIRCERTFLSSVKTKSCPWCNLSEHSPVNESTVTEVDALSGDTSNFVLAGHTTVSKARDQHRWPLLDRVTFLLNTKVNGSVEEIRELRYTVVQCMLHVSMYYPENRGIIYLLHYPQEGFCKERLLRCLHLLTTETDELYRAGCEMATRKELQVITHSGDVVRPAPTTTARTRTRPGEDHLSVRIVEMCLLLLHRMCLFLVEEARLTKGLRAQLLSVTTRLVERCRIESTALSPSALTHHLILSPLPPHTAALASALNDLVAVSE